MNGLRVVARANGIASMCCTTPQLPELWCSNFFHSSSAAIVLDCSWRALGCKYCDELAIIHTDVEHSLEINLKIEFSLGMLTFYCLSLSLRRYVFQTYMHLMWKIEWAEPPKSDFHLGILCFCSFVLYPLPCC